MLHLQFMSEAAKHRKVVLGQKTYTQLNVISIVADISPEPFLYYFGIPS